MQLAEKIHTSTKSSCGNRCKFWANQIWENSILYYDGLWWFYWSEMKTDSWEKSEKEKDLCEERGKPNEHRLHYKIHICDNFVSIKYSWMSIATIWMCYFCHKISYQMHIGHIQLNSLMWRTSLPFNPGSHWTIPIFRHFRKIHWTPLTVSFVGSTVYHFQSYPS